MTVTDLREYPTDQDASDMCELAASVIEALNPDLERLHRFVNDLSAWCANTDTAALYQQLIAIGRAVDMLRNSVPVFEGVHQLVPGDTDDVS